MNDNIKHPSHYTAGSIETIDYIRDTLTIEEFVGYCNGNVIKYISRWRKKGGVEDLKKAEVYIKWAIERAENDAGSAKAEWDQLVSRLPITQIEAVKG